MRRALKKTIAILLVAGLIVGGPAFAHTRMQAPAGAADHEIHAVQHYADLAVDTGTDECLQASPGANHGHDGLCDNCCTVCLGATVIPVIPVSVWAPAVAHETFFTRVYVLTAHVIPIEPGIPKSL